ncbi:MAG: myo-inositol-1(or 4)-monophosphatase [Alphaproteobacteria bacterium]|jgi:myo-inositol-1(or 4)-monophosphatase
MSYIFPQELKNTAFKAANAAKAITLKYFRNIETIDSKNTDHGWDPVTEADRRAEQIIRDIIEADFPNHAIIGEEYANKNTDSDYAWIIDPIDGTRAFIAGLPIWGTLIGVLYKNKPIFGLMSQPFVGDIFYGDCQTAFLQNNNHTQKLNTTDTAHIHNARMFCTTPDMFTTEQAENQFKALQVDCKTIRYGTDCYGYGALAAGWGDLVFESDVHAYDIFPMIPIIQGAGGIVTAPDGLDFKTGSVIASGNAILHNKALDLFKNL